MRLPISWITLPAILLSLGCSGATDDVAGAPQQRPPEARQIEPGDDSRTADGATSAQPQTRPQKQKDPLIELVDAVRGRPWDAQAIEALAKWFDSRDPPRARLVRLQKELSQVDQNSPRAAELVAEQYLLLADNEPRWTAPLAPLLENGGRVVTMKIGLVDSLSVEGATDDQLAFLKDVPELRQLELYEPQITAVGYAAIVALPHLDRLMIENPPLSEQNLAQLEKLLPWTAVYLYADDLDRAAVAAMNARRIAKFDQLGVDDKHSAGVRFLATFAYNPTFGKPLTAAQLNQSGITDAEMRLLSAVPELETVYISECYQLTGKGIAALAGLKNLKRLSIIDTTVESIAALQGLTNLEILEVQPEFDTQMGNAGLAGLQNFTKLEQLRLKDDAIGDATVERLAPLTNLRLLDLTLGHLEREASLAALANLHQLESLSLYGPPLSDGALLHLAGLKNLSTLSIHLQRGAGDGFRHLAALDNLQFLFLSGEGVSDAGIAHLARLRGLRSIMAQGSAVTQDGAQRLADQLPHLTVVLDDAVVKSPREFVTFRRRRFGDAVSLILPVDWTDDPQSGDTIWVREDGWQQIDANQIGPSEILMYFDSQSETAREAMRAVVNNNSRLNPKILEEGVLSLEGAESAASCIFQNDDNKHLVCAAEFDNTIVVLVCLAKPARFAEFAPLFEGVARSVYIGNDPQQHADQTLEVPAESLRPVNASRAERESLKEEDEK